MNIANTDSIPVLTEVLAANLSEQCRIDISANGNALCIPADVGDGALKHIIARLGAMQGSTERLDAMLRYNIGRTVMQLAASGPEKRDIEQVIDEADLPAILGRSAKTVSNWAYVARAIPPEDLKPVSWTVLSEAAASPPADPGKALEWRKKREELLEDAAQHPEEYTAKKVREKVKEIKTELCPSTGAERTVRESTNELMLRFVRLSRLLGKAGNTELQAIGIESQGALVDMIEALDNELVNRDEVTPDPLEENFYWIKKPVDSEADNDTDHHE